MLLYDCLFALVHISSLDGFSMKIIPTCLIFNFRSCHFLFKCAFLYGCFFWQNNFLWASAGVNGTFIYYRRQLQFLRGQLSCGVIQRRNKFSCIFGHFISHLWPQGRREAEDIGHFYLWRFLNYQCGPSLEYWTLRKMLTLTHLVHWFRRRIKLCVRHTQFEDQALKEGLGLSYTSVSLFLGRTNGFPGRLQ